MHKEIQKIWSLYRITNKINKKVYIGQAADVSKRWSDHRRAFRLNKPTQAIHHALIKYGLDNFEFEVIASCKTQDDANETETELVKQYDSFISNNKGYNVTYGGANAPKSEEWKQKMKDWHTSLSPEERATISQKQSISFTKYIEENGHPAQGIKWTDEQKANLSVSLKALDKEAIYTEEVRKHMSDAHIGKVLPEEQRKKMAASIKANWDKRNEKRFATGEIKCNAPGCEANGKTKTNYKIIDGIRYCNKHGLRLLRYGRLELKTYEYKPMSQSTKDKLSKAKMGSVPSNKIFFTEEQTAMILADPRSDKKIAKDFKVSPRVINRIKKSNIHNPA